MIAPTISVRAATKDRVPRDQELDVVGTECSPGVRRMMAAVGSETSFDNGRQQLHLLAGLEVTTKAVERHAEAIGADIVEREQAKRDRVVQLEFPDILGAAVPGAGISKWMAPRCPWCAPSWKGVPAEPRGNRHAPGKSNWVVSSPKPPPMRKAAPFGMPLPPPIPGRSKPPNCLAVGSTPKPSSGDGIGPKRKWCWATAPSGSGISPTSILPAPIQIVDVWHAREHLWDLAAKLFPSDEKQRKRWAKKLIQKLNRGRVENVVSELRSFPTRNAQLRDELRIQADYFERNRNRMRYPKFRKQGLFIGSGVIEAGCRTVIGSRLKQSGMFWTVRGANAIIALRCNRLSGKFEDYWASRSAAA